MKEIGKSYIPQGRDEGFLKRQLPNLKTIARIGRRIKGLHKFSPQQAEHIVFDELGIETSLERHITELDH